MASSRMVAGFPSWSTRPLRTRIARMRSIAASATRVASAGVAFSALGPGRRCLRTLTRVVLRTLQRSLSPERRLRQCSVHLEDGQEGLLRDLDRAHLLHALLALFLLLEELALAADVAAVALGEHVLAHGAHALAGDDLAADGG